MTRFNLSLNPQSQPPPQPSRNRPPMLGGFAVAFGVLGIVTVSIPFVPLAFVLSILALVVGQVGWGLLGLFLGLFGLVTSPVLMALIGLGAFVWLFDLPTFWPLHQPLPPPGGLTVPT